MQTNRSANPEHEKDKRWAAVDHYATKHLTPSGNTLYASLQNATQLAQEAKLPSIEVSPLQGRFLAVQCMAINAKNVLEVGTLGGYSSIWIASASPDIKITTVEIDPKHKAVAEKAHQHAGVTDQVEILLGSGVDVLPEIRKEVEAGKREVFDLVFIDADKENNLVYLEEAVPMCRPRAVIIVDNVVRKGSLADEEMAKKESRVQGESSSSRRVDDNVVLMMAL